MVDAQPIILAALIIVGAVLFAIVVAYAVVIYTDRPVEELVPPKRAPIEPAPRPTFCVRRRGDALSPEFFPSIEEYQRDFA